MSSVPADRSARAGHPRLWLAGLVLLVLGTVFFFVHHEPQSAVLPPPGSSTASDSSAREDHAGELLGRLTAALSHGTRAQTLALAAPGDRAAERELSTIYANVRRLRITDLSLRYVDEDDSAVGAVHQRGAGAKAWVGAVELTWRIKGFDRTASTMEVNLTFSRAGGRAAFVSARNADAGATPLWLLGKLTVVRNSRSLVMGAHREHLSRLAAIARHAVNDVNGVLPAWSGKLVLEVPASQTELNQATGSAEHAYDAIAAVTTTVGGSVDPTAPAHVFLNPPVFDKVGSAGQQIVMTHEATHVATGAAISTMPTWLSEGFADYVALAQVDLPVSVTASQILAQVVKSGTPRRLPGKAEFDAANPGLGASYESAWLACRLLAQRYGEQKLIAFYRSSDRASSTTVAFRDVLGTSEAAFTQQWRRDLERLAS